MGSGMQQETGPRSAFEQGLRQHLPSMFRFAVSLTARDDAEDVVQDALARAWAKRASFDPDRGSLLGWLLAIVADQARARWRRGSARRSFPVADLGDAPITDDGVEGTDLRRAVRELPPRQRTAIVLHHFVDLPVAEVAALMNVSAGTVKSTLHDARAALARELGATYALD
jgi:RNA polymerase sigma-70 factor (ECF subfamily)